MIDLNASNVTTIVTVGIIVLENILPHVPIKANSTTQLFIHILKAIGPALKQAGGVPPPKATPKVPKKTQTTKKQ